MKEKVHKGYVEFDINLLSVDEKAYLINYAIEHLDEIEPILIQFSIIRMMQQTADGLEQNIATLKEKIKCK